MPDKPEYRDLKLEERLASIAFFVDYDEDYMAEVVKYCEHVGSVTWTSKYMCVLTILQNLRRGVDKMDALQIVIDLMDLDDPMRPVPVPEYHPGPLKHADGSQSRRYAGTKRGRA